MLISAAKAHDAAVALGVELDGLTPSILKRAYRDKAKECHPDHHGTKHLSQWALISWSKDALTHWLKQNPPPAPSLEAGACRACGGTGKVRIKAKTFGAPLSMMCVLCRGTGSNKPEENDVDNDAQAGPPSVTRRQDGDTQR